MTAEAVAAMLLPMHPRSPRPSSLLAALLLCSCVPPESLHPLSDPAQQQADPRLSGTWTGDVNGSRTVLHLFPKTGPFLDLVLVGDDGEKGAVVLTFDAFPSVIGSRTYLNLRRKTFLPPYADATELAPTYIFARYELRRDGALTLWTMDDGPAKQAVAAGTLAGSVGEHAVQLTASTAQLAAFVAAADDAQLFHRLGTFKKTAARVLPRR